MTPAGQRDRRLSFERAAAVTSALGGTKRAVFAPFGITVSAKVLFGSGQERRQAGAEGVSLVATFRVLSSTETRAITEADRIRFDARSWDITSIVPIGVRAEIEFVATAAKD